MNKILIFFTLCSLPFIAFSDIAETRSMVSIFAEGNPKVLKMFDETAALWNQYFIETKGAFDLNKLLHAVEFSAYKHLGQYRKDEAKTPYIIHPIGVSRSLFEEGNIRSINVLTAALLHDTLEDTPTSPEEIEQLFGSRVRMTIEELTNDPTLSTQENKQRQVDHAPELSLNAQLVKLADRLYNVRDLRSPPPNWDKQAVDRYIEWGEKLLNALQGTNSSLEKALRSEIDTLRAK